MLASLLLLASLSTSVLASPPDSDAPVLGFCFIHEIAFPDGPQNEDLSQTLCQLLKKLHCEDGPLSVLNHVTGSEFINQYSDAQAQFCTDNAELVSSVLDGSNPEGMYILETSITECLYMLNHQEERRQLFLQQVFDWHYGAGVVVVFLLAVLALSIIAIAILAFGGRRRRALSSGTEDDAIFVQYNDVMEECATGSFKSWVCELSMMEFTEIFTVGLCAGTAGFTCMFNQDDVMAIANF